MNRPIETGTPTGTRPRTGTREWTGVLGAVLGPVAVLALVASAAGCAPPWGSTQQQPEQEELVEPVDLAARPALEQVVARYEQMQQRVRDRRDTELASLAAAGTEKG